MLYWIAFIFFHLLTLFISLYQGYNVVFHHISYALSIGHGPCIYLYTNILTKKQTSFNVSNLIHFTPTIICLLLPSVITNYDLFTGISKITSLICLLTYSILSLKRIKDFEKEIADLYSNIDRFSCAWLKNLNLGVFAIFILGTVFYGLYLWLGIILPFTLIYSMTMLLLCSFLIYKNLVAKIEMVDDDFETDNLLQNKDCEQSNSLINEDEDLQKLARIIESYIETEAPYLKMNLKLNDLAIALQVYPHHITAALNTIFNQNFNDFINSHRITLAKKKLLDINKNNTTIIAVAYDCGFNSKTSFYRVFKQNTGMTPTEYIRIEQN